jgi:hypothetical protein
MIRAVLAAAVLVALSVAATGQEARPGQPGWTTTAEGCRVWNEVPQEGERATWSGGCVDGMADGRGTMRWTLRSGDETYDGEMSKGRPNGRGVYVWADGDRYDGEWRGGDMHGRGVYVWANGNRYDGEWSDDRMHGRGSFVAAEGDRYDGEWRNDKRHGHGKEVFVGDGFYEGAYADDLPNGMGTFTNAKGEVFSGEWTNGCFRRGASWAHVGVTAEDCGFK